MYAGRPPPTAGWLPGSSRVPSGPRISPCAAGAVQGEQRAVDGGVGVADGEDADGGLRGRGGERERGDASAAASSARSERRMRGRSAIAACSLPPPDGASAITGSARPTPNASPMARPVAGSPTRDADPGQRPHGEGEDEGGEAEPEQDAVEAGGERDGQDAAPGLRDLAADLGDDPRVARLAERRGQRDGGGDVGRVRAERVAEQGEPAERDHAAGERAGGERRARDHGRPQPLRVAARRERLDHREPARRPRAGHARDQRGDDHDGRQHLTFVWKYMTQNTLRPR